MKFNAVLANLNVVTDDLLSQFGGRIRECEVKVANDCRSGFRFNWVKLELCTTSASSPIGTPDFGLTLGLSGLGLMGFGDFRLGTAY